MCLFLSPPSYVAHPNVAHPIPYTADLLREVSNPTLKARLADYMCCVWRFYHHHHSAFIEVNPLALTTGGVQALDVALTVRVGGLLGMNR